MNKFINVIIIVAIAAFVSSCGGGGNGPSPTVVSVNSLDGTTGVPVNGVFRYTFTNPVQTSSVTSSSYFMVAAPAGSAIVAKSGYDPTICNPGAAIGAGVSCSDSTTCDLAPSSDLAEGTLYSICLSDNILYADGTAFSGFMASFTTAGSSYSVGGTASGLDEGEQLVLQNNAGDDLTITADGAFVFATSLADGDEYAVSVLTAPANKTCTVGNGTGTIAGADITNVSVVCSFNAFKVGGTVSGLMGTAVLQNNAADDLTISANGSFTFATRVADGGPYAVTVKTQPSSPSQMCTVNNGTGMLNGADVTNVSVICSTNSYTVGGSVSGLAGSGLVLQDNSGDDLPIAADGLFTFATKVASGAGYAVTVKTQPTSLSQTCTVTHSSGTMGGSNVTNVDVTCTTNTYFLGGALTGFVPGKTLVLLNNGGDPLTLSPPTPSSGFVFSQKLVDGSAFDVTVGTNPVGMTCSVNPASSHGTINGSDNFGLEVWCFMNRYWIGGTVSGLDGTAVLQNNGGNDLTISADGTFKFTEKIEYDGAYDVTVKTQPSTQICEVTNGSGTVGEGDVTNIEVDCDYEAVIFSTDTASYSGNLGGIAGADAICNGAANKPDSRSYKAMVVDGTNRRACSSANCSGGPSEHVDWVLEADTSYYRPGLAVRIGTTTANGIFGFPLENGMVAGPESSLIWTGFTTSGDWMTQYTCGGWTSNSAGEVGNYGASGDTSAHSISAAHYACNITYGNLICVSQD